MLIEQSALSFDARCSAINAQAELMATVSSCQQREALTVYHVDQAATWQPSSCCPEDFLADEMLPGNDTAAAGDAVACAITQQTNVQMKKWWPLIGPILSMVISWLLVRIMGVSSS
jgi:hypothetical protein